MFGHKFYPKLFILGVSLLALGLLTNYALPPAIEIFINTQIALEPGSQSYPMWKDIPVPVYQKFFFFNVTNAQDIEQRGHKPMLEEIGPFTYKSDWTKRDIEANLVDNKINFKHFKEWQFVPEMSIADHRLPIVTLNAPLAITLTLIQSASNAVRLLVTFSLDGLSDGFFTKRTIKQLLFDGYPDLLTTFGPLLNAEMLSQGGHFGYMNARNNSLDGEYEINTGADDISKLNTINKFNGQSELPYWLGKNSHAPNQCSSLAGSTTGEMFPPIPDDDDDDDGEPATTKPPPSIKLFQPDFCRVWRLDYHSSFEQDSTGLLLKRFHATRDVFRNSTDLPENSCFFAHPRRSSHSSPNSDNRIPEQSSQQLLRSNRPHGFGSARRPAAAGHHPGSSHSQNNRVRHEWPAGVFTLAPCKFNAPIYMSMPHFLDADPYFNAQVDGLRPDPQRHEFFVDLEPRTGSPVVLSARVQLNVAISKPPGLVRFRNVPEIMFPVFWQELTVNVTENKSVIDQLQLASRGAIEATIGIAYSLLVLGGAILITIGIFYIHWHFNDLPKPEASQDESSRDGEKRKEKKTNNSKPIEVTKK